jgi:hypothetical protein
MADERRRGNRVFVKLPITLEGGKGVTRDVNANGIYFESDVNCVPGSELSYSLEFDNPGSPKMTWICKAMVIRVDRQDGKMGIAARITQSSLSPKAMFTQDADTNRP